MPGSVRKPPPEPARPLLRGEVRALAMIAALAVLLLIAAIVHQIGTLFMKRITLAAALAAAALGLSGCAGVGRFLTTTQADDTVGARILNDIQGCKRNYNGSLGPTGIQGSFSIDCDPVAPPPAAVPPPV